MSRCSPVQYPAACIRETKVVTSLHGRRSAEQEGSASIRQSEDFWGAFSVGCKNLVLFTRLLQLLLLFRRNECPTWLFATVQWENSFYHLLQEHNICGRARSEQSIWWARKKNQNVSHSKLMIQRPVKIKRMNRTTLILLNRRYTSEKKKYIWKRRYTSSNNFQHAACFW